MSPVTVTGEIPSEPSMSVDATSSPLAARRVTSCGDAKPVVENRNRGTCQYLQSRHRGDSSDGEGRHTAAKSCSSPSAFVPIVPAGRPEQIGNKWIDIKHCCVSPCSSPVPQKLAGLTLNDISFERTGYPKMTFEDDAIEEDDEGSNCEASDSKFNGERGRLRGNCDETSDVNDCDATGFHRKSSRDTHDETTRNKCNQRKPSCAETAEEIFCKKSNDDGTCSVDRTYANGSIVEKADKHCEEVLDPNNNSGDLVKPCGIPRSFGKAPVIGSLTDLVTELHHIFEEDHVNVDYVEFVMKSYKSVPSEWRKYAKFDKFK